MTRPARVLVVEDIAHWRHAFGRMLERTGARVTTASTGEEAQEKLRTGFYHIVLLDIQLDQGDPDNRDGLDLLADMKATRLLEAMSVIVTTGHDRSDYMRESFRQHTVDYLIKDELGDGDVLIEKVQQVLRDEVRFNGDLEILWQSDAAQVGAVVGLWVRGKRVRRDTPEAGAVREELEDLLCRLFPTASSVMVDVMRPGLSGSGVLRVGSFTISGAAEPVVVKFGDAQAIRREYDNYTRYVEDYVVGHRATTARGKAFTAGLGGIIYSFVGVEGDRLEDFGDFYRRSELDAIGDVLRRLFNGTCGRWYGNRRPVAPRDLGTDYRELLGFTVENLERARAERLHSVQAGPRLRFASLTRDLTFRNVIPLAGDRFIRSTVTAITHGDFNEHNILLDRRGDAWLIDFMRTGPGHILRDVAQLDSVVRFQLLGPDEATLDERFEMESALSATTRTDQLGALTAAFGTTNPALRKVFETSVGLRAIAARLIEAGGLGDFGEYQIASMFFAVNTIRFYSLPQTQREHALLAACVLAERFVT
jgi:CheY-like chemotaxis protein